MHLIEESPRFFPAGIEDRIEDIDWQGNDVREVDSIDLYSVPIGTVIKFGGEHFASQYLLKKVGDEEIVISHGPKRNAKGHIDAISSQAEFMSRTQKGGMLIVGEFYILPTFHDPDYGIRIDYASRRVEPYRRILVHFPS
jgi:hypothetical protein